MNYFGFLFSFIVPGMFLGYILYGAVAAYSVRKRRERRRAKSMASRVEVKNRLRVWSLEHDCAKPNLNTQNAA